MRQVVAYFRVSTDKQGKSGLGIEAQREVVCRFAEAEGLEVLGEHTEAETGRGADALETAAPCCARRWRRLARQRPPGWWRSWIACPATWRSSPG